MASFSSHCFLIPPATVTSIIPIMKLARLLAARGARVTIYIPAAQNNESSSSSTSWFKQAVLDDEFKASVDLVEVQISEDFLQEEMMQEPIEIHMAQQLQQQQQPHHVPASGIIADRLLFRWTKEIADKFMIPLLSISTLFNWSGTPYRLKHYMPVAVAVAAVDQWREEEEICSDPVDCDQGQCLNLEEEICSDAVVECEQRQGLNLEDQICSEIDDEICSDPVDCDQGQCLNLEEEVCSDAVVECEQRQGLNLEDQICSEIDDEICSDIDVDCEQTECLNLEEICSSVLRLIMDNGAAAHTTPLHIQEDQISSGGEYTASSSSSSSHSHYVVIAMNPFTSPTSRMGLLLVKNGGAKITMYTPELNEWLMGAILDKYKGLSQPPQIVQVSNIGIMKEVVERHMDQQPADFIAIIADRDLYWAPETAKKFVIPLFTVTRPLHSSGQLGHYMGHYQPDSSILSHEATNTNANANQNANGGFLMQYRWSLTLEDICETVIRTRGLSFQEIEIFMNNAAENQELPEPEPEPETEAAIVAENQELPEVAVADNTMVAENQELDHIGRTLLHMQQAFADLAVEVDRQGEMVDGIEQQTSRAVYLLESWITALKKNPRKRLTCIKFILPPIIMTGIWSSYRYAGWKIQRS